MKTYPLPPIFSGKKFAQRYNLNPLKPDFWVDGNRLLNVPDNLPDDPPIFDPPDPPVDKYAALKAAIDAYKAPPATDPRLSSFLTELRKVFA